MAFRLNCKIRARAAGVFKSVSATSDYFALNVPFNCIACSTVRFVRVDRGFFFAGTFVNGWRGWGGGGFRLNFNICARYGFWYLGLLVLVCVAIKHAGWLARRFLLVVAVPRLILLSSLIVCCRRLMGISSELQNPRARCGRFQIGFYYVGLFCVECALQLHCVFIGTIRTR